MNIVITGASSGIGKAMVKKYALNGYPVLAIARREDRLSALRQEISELNAAPITCLTLDITSEDAPHVIFDEAVRLFGKIHGLVNNAGMSPYQEFHELSFSHICQIIDLNIRSLTELCYLFMPHMISHGEPSHIVNVSSVGGYAPLPRFSIYTGSKHYVRIFTNLLTREYRRTNIRVSGLYPGGVLTEFPQLSGQRVKEFARKNMLTPEQLVDRAYPAILKGKRVIVPGAINKLAVFMGKLLPFPWAFWVMKFIYDHNLDRVDPAYPP
jgi:short-subunit dehydrogenase